MAASRIKRPFTLGLAVVTIVFGLWLVLPSPDRFRSFDPAVVGKAEAGLWRAYYERRRADLATGLALSANRAFGLSPWDSIEAGFSAAAAARTFQRSGSRAEAQAALPALTRHFRVMARTTGARIDPAREAALELEWWQARRETDAADYAPQVAAATAYLYGIEPARLTGYAELRVQAMDLRDRHGRNITEADWREIERLLVEAYAALRTEL